MRSRRHRRWLSIWALMSTIMGMVACEFVPNSTHMMARHSSESVVFAPRMDYEQWTPIGRGDPLKNDPTYDYVPPMLEHVHYWVDPAARKPDPPPAETSTTTATAPPKDEGSDKQEILMLGVSAKKPADPRRDIYDPYLKYADVQHPKFQQNHYQRDRYYPYPHHFYSGPTTNYKTKSNYKGGVQQVPFTVLMPPPLPEVEKTPSTTEREEGYHTADSTSVTWRTPLAYPKPIIKPMSVTPRPLPSELYKLGKVENAPMHSYVAIGKPEAHIQTTNDMSVQIKQELNPNIPSTMASFLAAIPKATTKSYVTTTTPPPPTTVMHTLTTDPLFKHYKQPAEPMRGPMYFVIQGHSKVKTYGPAKQLYGINVQEANEIPYEHYKSQVKHLHAAYRKKEEYMPARLGRGMRPASLAELAATGFRAIDASAQRRMLDDEDPIDEETMNEESMDEDVKVGRLVEDVDLERMEDDDGDDEHDVKETELVGRFAIADGDVASSAQEEVYHKGIVESIVRR